MLDVNVKCEMGVLETMLNFGVESSQSRLLCSKITTGQLHGMAASRLFDPAGLVWADFQDRAELYSPSPSRFMLPSSYPSHPSRHSGFECNTSALESVGRRSSKAEGWLQISVAYFPLSTSQSQFDTLFE